MIREKELKAELVKNGHNITWLAENLGYTPANLYNKINGKTAFTLDEVNKIRKILNLSDDMTSRIFFYT